MKNMARWVILKKPQARRQDIQYSVSLDQMLEGHDSYALSTSSRQHSTKAYRRGGKVIMGPFAKMEPEYQKLVQRKLADGYRLADSGEDATYEPKVRLQVTPISTQAARCLAMPPLETSNANRTLEVTASYGWIMQECFPGTRCSVAVRRGDGYAITDQTGQPVAVTGAVVSGLTALTGAAPNGTRLEGVWDGTVLHVTDAYMLDGEVVEADSVQTRLLKADQVIKPLGSAALGVADTFFLPGGKRAAIEELRGRGAVGVVFKSGRHAVLHLFE